MHTIMVIAGGLLLLGVFALVGRFWAGQPAGAVAAAKLFIPVWLAIALINMWVGVTRAGYSVTQELPFLLVVFAVPAAAAAAVIWLANRP